MTMAENLYEITSGLACGQAGAAKAMSSVIGHFTDGPAHVTEAEKADWGGRLDAPPGGAPGQVLTASGSGAVWADAKGRKPSLFTLEEKSVRAGEPYEADLNGRQIQKYSLGSAASGTIEIAVKGLADIPTGAAQAVELQIPVQPGAEVSAVVLPQGAQAARHAGHP